MSSMRGKDVNFTMSWRGKNWYSLKHSVSDPLLLSLGTPKAWAGSVSKLRYSELRTTRLRDLAPHFSSFWWLHFLHLYEGWFCPMPLTQCLRREFPWGWSHLTLVLVCPPIRHWTSLPLRKKRPGAFIHGWNRSQVTLMWYGNQT